MLPGNSEIPILGIEGIGDSVEIGGHSNMEALVLICSVKCRIFSFMHAASRSRHGGSGDGLS
jgi:hypothetical protein